MLPIRVISLYERPAPVQTGVPPVQRRPDLATLPRQTAVEILGPPKFERRVNGNRRQNERREKEQNAFLDTRTPQGRRRSAGRRAEDQFQPGLRIAISVKA